MPVNMQALQARLEIDLIRQAGSKSERKAERELLERVVSCLGIAMAADLSRRLASIWAAGRRRNVPAIGLLSESKSYYHRSTQGRAAGTVG